ncbi:MAG: hypothetical protein ACLQBX_15910 [Candidatus Limnocylindrales bacterium]
MSKGLRYAFGAIALYLMVAYTGGVNLVKSSAAGVSGVAKTFQGR